MSVSSRRQTPTWPFFVVLVSLFALSLTAPRKWEKVARSKPLMTSAKRSYRAKPTLLPSLPFRTPSSVVRDSRTPVESRSPAIVADAPESTDFVARSPAARDGEPTLAASEPPAPRGPLPDLGVAIGKLAPPPSLIGPDGQISLRVPADLSPVLAMKPEKPIVFDEEAESVLREALKVKNDSAMTHFYLGRSLAGQNKADAAETAFRTALTMGGNDMVEARRALANIYLQRGDNEKALAEIEAYLLVNPKPADEKKLRETVQQIKNELKKNPNP